jgi:hypothetical protein
LTRGTGPAFSMGRRLPATTNAVCGSRRDVLPAGFHASPCSAANVCCQNDWPFSSSELDYPLCRFLYAYGSVPATPDRQPPLAVSIDPALAPGTGTFSCEGPEPFSPFSGDSPCKPNARAGVWDLVAADRPYFNVSHYDLWWYGYHVSVELDLSGQSPQARVCAVPYTDYSNHRCRMFAGGPVCAASGTIVLSSLPSPGVTVSGRIDVNLRDLHLTASF